MNQPAFDFYPHSPGFKAQETSKEAAASINASLLRQKVLAEFQRRGAMTADECAMAVLPNLDPLRAALSIRPRISELHRLGSLMTTDLRRKNASGKSAIVWKIP